MIAKPALAAWILVFGSVEYLRAADPPHGDLSYYTDAAGAKQSVKTVEDWRKRREQILAGMQEAMGPLPSWDRSQPPQVRVAGERKVEGLIEKHIFLAVEPGDELPALLYVPENAAGRLPAIVALHPTGAPGKRLIAGEDPKVNRGYGIEMAQKGFVVICPDYVSFGDYAAYNFDTDHYISGTMKGIFNHMRCVDYLQSLPNVDGEKIAAIGHSLGGHNAIFLGVFDERVKAVVSSCGWTPFHDYYGGKIAGWTSPRYMPSLKEVYGLDPDKVPFDFYELTAALAPRGFFSSSPLHDENFDVNGVKKAEPKARAIYGLHSAADNLRIIYPNCEHDFPIEAREESYAFIKRVLDE